jgi:hypothetical protein
MLVVTPGQSIEIPFVYKSGYEYVDPESNIIIFLKRGLSSVGPTIIGPYVYDIDLATAASPGYSQSFSATDSVERVSEGYYNLVMQMPTNAFDGQYTVEINTTLNGSINIKEINVHIKAVVQSSESDYSLFGKSVSINSTSKYNSINQFDTNNILLIGHTDAIEPYGIQKISSIQEGVDLLRADVNSPLLRGMFDAYSCGARDIYIMSAGYMNQYVDNVAERNVPIFKDTVNDTFTFYEMYYNSLAICYNLIEQYDFIDFVVPLEASMINTGTVNFAKQLANFCNKIQENTGEVTIGILGSKNQGVNSEDVTELINKDFDIQSIVDGNGFITKDTGKHLVLVYGEAVFAHKQLQVSYSSSLAAATAGLLSSTQVNFGISNQRIPAALSGFGVELTTAQVKSLNDVGINSITKGSRSRRFAGPYDVYLSGDFTQSISENFKDSSNVRLAAMIISEVQAISKNAIGKFGYSKITDKVEALLNFLKINDIVRNYSLDAYADKQEKGKMYFNITLVSSRTLRELSFNVASGRGA